MSEELQRRVVYHGQVQGVGFRFTARHIARSYAVRGYVRNLRDGTVEIVAAGASGELQRFLDAVAEAMRGCIERIEETPAPPLDATGFEVRH